MIQFLNWRFWFSKWINFEGNCGKEHLFDFSLFLKTCNVAKLTLRPPISVFQNYPTFFFQKIKIKLRMKMINCYCFFSDQFFEALRRTNIVRKVLGVKVLIVLFCVFFVCNSIFIQFFDATEFRETILRWL